MSIDPALALQTAVRSTLINAPAITSIVSAHNIRAGVTRPERMPSILLSDARTEYLGVASGSQRVARVFLTLHVWAQESAQDTARQIGAAAHRSLEFGPTADALRAAGIEIDEWERISVVWLRDPQPEIANTHGVMLCEAVVRWRV